MALAIDGATDQLPARLLRSVPTRLSRSRHQDGQLHEASCSHYSHCRSMGAQGWWASRHEYLAVLQNTPHLGRTRDLPTALERSTEQINYGSTVGYAPMMQAVTTTMASVIRPIRVRRITATIPPRFTCAFSCSLEPSTSERPRRRVIARACRTPTAVTKARVPASATATSTS